MVNQCAFTNCKNKAKRWAPQSFHHFPVRDPGKTKLWLIAAGLDMDTPMEALRNRMVCSDHFSPDDFTQSKIRLFLKMTVVPSVFPSAPTASDEEQVQNGDKFTHRIISNTSYLPGSIEVTFEPDQTEQNMSEPEAPAQSDGDEDDVSEEEEEGDKGNQSSDEDWLPQTLTEEGSEEVRRDSSSEEDFSEGEELNEDQKPTREPKKKELCTECGAFYCTQKHVCEHKTKPYVCNVCGKRCVTELSLRLHSNIHSETYEHYCKYCYATFKTKLDKLAHEEIHQNEPRPYRCPDCTVTFAKNSERRKHLKKHRGQKKYICDICGIVFLARDSLQRHEMTHTGMKPHKCSICKRTFTQRGHLKSHMRVHTGEQPYKCQHCDKSFNHNVSLKSHTQCYHPLESGEKYDKSCDDVIDTNDIVQNQDTEKIQKKVKRYYGRYSSGRPLGRPKKNSTVSSESSEH